MGFKEVGKRGILDTGGFSFHEKGGVKATK